MCEDEVVASHKGKRAGLLRQFIPRKPQSTGLKLYVLADGPGPYLYHMYLYTGNSSEERTGHVVHNLGKTPLRIVDCLTRHQFTQGVYNLSSR